jgi:hypothetical protein
MIPAIHDFPVRRPGFIQSCEWIGPDNQLALKVTYYDAAGSLRATQFATRNIGDGYKGEVCIPTSNVLTDLGTRYEDILTAHTRMACLIARSGVPGSDEFTTALQQGISANLNTALGIVKVTATAPVDDSTVAITYRQGTGPTLTVNMDYSDLNNYQFVPETQLFIIPGSIKKQFGTYVHDFPGTLLSQERRDEIVAYVLTLAPWI